MYYRVPLQTKKYGKYYKILYRGEVNILILILYISSKYSTG